MTNPWDNNVSKRHKQILDGLDFSFDKVLSPTFIKLLRGIENISKQRALDLGCGSGILTSRVSRYVRNVVGIDPSEKSIRIAKNEYKNIKNLKFVHTSIINHQAEHKYDLVISNMTIQAIKNVRQVLSSTERLINRSGTFIFSIPHPCFWIEYRKKIGLDEYKNFTYGKNSTYHITFSISNDRTPLPSRVPFYHRHLEYYTNALRTGGFYIQQILEPFPKSVQNLEASWETPHFLFFVCRKSN